MAEESAVLTSLKIALDIAQGIQALATEAEVNIAVIDLQRRLLNEQQLPVGGPPILTALRI